MRLVWAVVRGVVSLALVALAGLCIVRGMNLLFWPTPVPGVSRAQQAASYSGVGSALLYFAGGVLALVVAGAVSPKKP
jgi:ABC-type phosphate transport system auxiliary subunit